MGRKTKTKNRKARAASVGPNTDPDPSLRESESSEAVSAASSLIGDEDDRPSLVAADEPIADVAVQVVAVDEAADETVAASDASVDVMDAVNALSVTEDVQSVGVEATIGETTSSIIDDKSSLTTDVSIDAEAEAPEDAVVAYAVQAGEVESTETETFIAEAEAVELTEVSEEVASLPTPPSNDVVATPVDEIDAQLVEEQDAVVQFSVEEHDVAAFEVAVESATLVTADEESADVVATSVEVSETVGLAPEEITASEELVTEESMETVVSMEEIVVVQRQTVTVVTEEVTHEEHHSATLVTKNEQVKQHQTETFVAEEVAVEEQRTASAATEEISSEEHHSEALTTQDEHVEQVQTTAEEIAVEEHYHTDSVLTEEFAVEEQAENVVTEGVAVEEFHTEADVAEDVAVEDHHHTDDVATAEGFTVKEQHSETVFAEDERIVENHTETIKTEEVAAIEEHDERPVVAEVVAAVEEHTETVETEEIAIEEHTETIESEQVAVEEHRVETVVAEEEEPIVEHQQSESALFESFGEQQSVEPIESRAEATTAMALEDLDVSDKVASTHSIEAVDAASEDHLQVDATPAISERIAEDSADRKARARPMLTTERSFVMEDDDTVKADDTVVVSERMSTDGEDDLEDMTLLPSEGFQAAVIANSMSMMSPVLEKRHLEAIVSEQNGTNHHQKASTMAPTASSAAGRSSEGHTSNVTPTRVRSRSRSGSRQSTPDAGFVKPPPAPPTVPVPPKRASIMAPTASYAAKHQSEDAPKKTPTRVRSQSSEAKPEISDTGFIKPPPAPPTVPVPPKRASIMAPTASYAAKHQTEDGPKKTPTRVRTDKHAKPEISDTGFIKPPPAPPTVPVPPKRASIMAPTASSSAKRGHEAEDAVETKAPPRSRRLPGAKPEVSDTGFVKPPPPPPTVPIAPKRASIMAPTASSAAKRSGPDVSVDEWSRDAPPKPAPKAKAAEFVPTVPVAPKRASIMAPTASFRAKSGPEVVVEELSPPPVETKLYRNKRYANVQSKVRGIINAPAKTTESKPSAPPAVEEPKRPAPAQKPTMFKSKRYANVQSKIKDIIHSGSSQPDPSAVERRRSLGSAKRDTAADVARRRSSLAGTSTLRSSKAPGSGSGLDSSDPFAQALAARAHKKKLNNAVPRYLSYENSGVYAQRAQVQQERRRRLEEQNASKSQTRQHQLRVVFAEKLHVNYNAQEAEHSQAALGNVGARARRVGGKTRGSRSSSASDEFSTSSESKPAPVAVAGGVIVLPSSSANGSSTETIVESIVETSAVLKAAATIEADAELPQTKADDGVTKKINFDDASDDEEEEVAVPVPIPVADVA